MARAPTGESSIARAARIIAAFTAGETSLTVTEIARRTGLHIATASRLIAELTTHGLLARGPVREVRVGVRLWELAARASPTTSLRDAAMPYLEDLHAVVGHHAQLSVLDGDDVLFVERLSARDAVINYSQIAGRLPVHLSSSGHVLLAYAPAEARERVLRRPMRRSTAATITTPDGLERAWAAVRRQGYALLPGHVHEDATGIAVPVRDALNDVVAALSIIVPNDDHAHAGIPALLAAARGVTRTLSGRR
ncbi:DNA-binding transcriptional regulator, IclR family [Amycolatopsis pretoriensis]|uniref:DNA-binding transcriptional regulator, IclR family n=1 Tax=Amycolatopsis pretoriensis TaxID=218821 RepID=A0A1H5QBM9_9PSEU|nr:IclR family transcriptional regulator [Amycolatopsis pretoriensis]SEF23553.1 DNA-binding transcriptional regulator, IclR family [Amycolatopsis pretoriensis]